MTSGARSNSIGVVFLPEMGCKDVLSRGVAEVSRSLIPNNHKGLRGIRGQGMAVLVVCAGFPY